MAGTLSKNKLIKYIFLSLGVTASQIALILIGMSDSVMMGRESSAGLAAGTWVSSIYNLGLLFCMGMIIPIAIIIGRSKNHHGQSNVQIIAQYCRIVFILSVLVAIFLVVAVRVNYFFGEDQLVLEIAEKYAFGIIPGIFPWVMFYLIRNILLCEQKVKLTTVLSILSVILNIVLNYLFIYGVGNIKGLGTTGCAVATSITNWIIFLIAFVILRRNKRLMPTYKELFQVNHSNCKEILKLGLPTGLMFFSESLIFAAGNSMLASINTEAVVAFGIAVSWLNLSYMFPVALSQVVTEPLTEYYTMGKYKEFTSVSNSALKVTLIYNIVCIMMIIFFRKYMIYAIIGNNSTESIYFLAEIFLYFTAAIIFVYNFIVVFSGILRGFGDVKTPLLMMFIMYWVIGVGGTLVLTYFIGSYGVLIGMLIGFTLTFLGIMSTYRRKMSEEFNETRISD